MASVSGKRRSYARGVDVLELADPTRPRWDGGTGPRPVQTYVWRPRAERPPVALLSHGTGGHARELAWLAEALVDAGFAVLAPEHHGVSGDVLPEGFAFGWERARDLSFVLDHGDDVDSERVVAVGNSGGAYAVAALLGARLDHDVYQGLMNADNELSAELLSRNPHLRPADVLAAATASYADGRIAKAFLLAPVLGPMLDRASLAAIDRPVRIRWGEDDDIAPPEENAAVYLDAIPNATGAALPCGHLEFSGDIDDPLGIRATVAKETVAFFTAGRR